MSKFFPDFSSLLPWKLKSLKARLRLSALLIVVLVLPLIGVTLNSAFEAHIKSAIHNELAAYSYSILAVAEVEQQELLMPELLLENQFNVIESGLYALITKGQLEEENTQQASRQEILWLSNSLLGLDIPYVFPQPALGRSLSEEIDLNGEQHLIYSFSASFSDGEQDFPVTIHIIKNQADLLVITGQFKRQLWLWLLVLMALLLLIQMSWLNWTLKPLHILKGELQSVEQGKTDQLQARYPLELEQVTGQLNLLLHTEQNQRQRYRNALSDLAHSLKTPLAVMQSQADLPEAFNEQLAVINRTIEHQLKRAQSAGESSWHLGILIKPVALKLVSALEKIYRHKALNISVLMAEEVLFKGDEADLMELLGNMLDNACKAAKQRVVVKVNATDGQLVIRVEDDGQGISEDQREKVLNRGTRADTYEQGHGIGLAIIRDIVTSYQGELLIEESRELGGACFMLCFNEKKQ
ncbi:GHKL domain-containing protein [Thalassomonas viridans]|uniref:histidine kinase n=1 Tax=Thalassomonas viridans TaxID=137584 RepID=A0AAF0CAY1_9GAMM|nr:ATP-binding protein [Thalassomonas viridans]WDE06810.1 GHKL domain-containing protein [Thalassomonas viridans]